MFLFPRKFRENNGGGGGGGVLSTFLLRKQY